MRALGASRTSVVPGGALAGSWARNALWKTARALPSLDLRFADNKTLGDAYGGGSPVTFTRASSATYTGSDGIVKTATTNEARFDHNPTTGESLGLLVEEARTNLVTASADFSTGWTTTRATLTTNQTTAPDGTTTADLLTEDTSTNTHVLQSNFSVTAGTSYTLSVWVKQNTSVSPTRNIRLFFPSAQFTTQVAAGFDLTTGVITPTNSPVATSLQFYANGWVRISCTATCTTSSASSSISFQMTSGVLTTYTGGSSGLYLWGAQFEAGAFMTSYIPTTGTTATRAADVASITGSNFNNWFNANEGSLFAQYRTPASGTRSVATFNDGTANERMNLYSSTTDPKFIVVDGGATQADLDGGTISINTETRAAIGYAVNNFAMASDNGSAVTDTSGTLPTVTQLLIGNDQANNYQNGIIKRLIYWPTRLTDTTLQQITQP
jgi:hypothetical protein